MGQWERHNENDEYYTPKYIFDGLGCRFDMDVAAPVDRTFCHVPAKHFITENSLELEWNGFVWMNPPYSGKNQKEVWLDKLYRHGNGIGLTPDRTSAPWWPVAARNCDALLLMTGKIKFIRSDGTVAGSPGNGTTLFGFGRKAVDALLVGQKNGLGVVMQRMELKTSRQMVIF